VQQQFSVLKISVDATCPFVGTVVIRVGIEIEVIV
jgi:hypothetical protein